MAAGYHCSLMYSCSPYWWCLDANYRSSMISRPGPSCFGQCKIQNIKKVSLPATSHNASPDLHATPLISTAARHSNQRFQRLVLLQRLLLFIGIECSSCSCLSQASPQEPSRIHALAVLPVCGKMLWPSHRLCHGHSHLSKQQPWNTMRRQLSTSAAKSASADKAVAVQAEFAKASTSAEATQEILYQHKTYLNRDSETKLRPALQSWLQELGTEQLSQQLQKVRRLLACKPQECSEVYLWLSSKGINTERGTAKGAIRHDKGLQSSTDHL